MSKTPAPIFFHIKDYFKLRPELTYGGARNRYATAKKAFAKEDHQYLTIEDIAKYEGIAVETVRQCLTN